MLLRHKRSGAYEIPALGIVVEPGAEFECPDDIAEALCAQVDNYEPVTKAAAKSAEGGKKSAPAEKGADV